ncbi:MAG: MOSC domain-containing protein [Cyclobacteriaceae bacterium]
MRPDGVTISDLMNQQAQQGRVCWISIRPERRKPPLVLAEIYADASSGLENDHYSKEDGKRQVTLINEEHIKAIASFLGKENLNPGLLRRNIVVKGINLLSLKNKKFSIGEAVFETSGECHPCSRMEENLGAGGYNAVRGHGGITARIVRSGLIKLGDQVSML